MFLTRCPHCQTTFRLMEEQLTARNGRVRCGACKQIFNAQENLQETDFSKPSFNPVRSQGFQGNPGPTSAHAENPSDALLMRTMILMPDAPLPFEMATPAPTHETRHQEPQTPQLPGIPNETAPFQPSVAALPPEVRVAPPSSPPAAKKPIEKPDEESVHTVPPRRQAIPQNMARAAHLESHDIRNPLGHEIPKTAEEEQKQVSPDTIRQQTLDAGLRAPRHAQELPRYSPWSSSLLDDLSETNKYPVWPFVITAIFLCLILGIQATYHYRSELSQRVPTAARIYRAFNLPLSLPRERNRISIEEFDMKDEADPALSDDIPPSRLRFMLTLRNNAPYSLAWPHLELTLSDIHGAILVRKTLSPQDYLPANTAASFPPGNTPIRLLLDKGELPTFSYQVDHFYP